MEDQPVPEPAEINQQKLPKSAADDPYGPPVVTAKAWAIADASSGKILWSHEQDTQLDIASTTKIMTAYIVMKYCDQHPETLKETITFSRRADKTIGSTSGLREGEVVSVGDLLYGLMLPSGNDAATALAEHFGKKLGGGNNGGEASSAASSDGLDAFIESMNREAEQLGMKKTRFGQSSWVDCQGAQVLLQ